MAVCYPSIKCDEESDTHTSKGKMPAKDPEVFVVKSHISFTVRSTEIESSNLPGLCWHDMFKNPVMVAGWPILPKPEPGLGVEMPLNMISRLAGSNRANQFNQQVCIKGFATMVVAARIIGEIVVWHYCFNKYGLRIAYFDNGIELNDNITLNQLSGKRHLVGWCTSAMYCAGE